MDVCDVVELQKSTYEEPSFFVDYYNVGRGVKGKHAEGPRIVSTKRLIIWKIIEDNLSPPEFNSVFFNHETYLIQWTFDYILVEHELREETVFFYWKGSNAARGLSPLPDNFNNDTTVVYRIVQWSEPAIFFQIFPKPLTVLNGKFDQNSRHMFIILGELLNELHLYEIPYQRKNLRSRGVFVLIVPDKRIVYLWKGSKCTKELLYNVQESKILDTLKNLKGSWEIFNIMEIEEKEEDELFHGDVDSYFHIVEECNFTPRLFYLHSMTGVFSATEVEYPLKNKDQVAAFPFLQSHLLTADQPGLFLLDNNHEIWLIQNGSDIDSSSDVYNLATKMAASYANLRKQFLKKPVTVRIVDTDTNNIEFTNIFPYWN